jgi:hypothetical protein
LDYISAATTTQWSTPTSALRSWRPRSSRLRPVEPPVLVAPADALLDELPDGWLRDQVAARD